MSRKEFYIDTGKKFEYDDNLVFIDTKNNLARLRRRDIYNRWDPEGKYPASGFIVFENFRADCLSELYSFEHCVHQSGINVDYQLSPDNGQTYYYYSGSSWVQTSGINDFSVREDVDLNISTFPLSFPKQIRLKTRLRSYESGTKTPIFNLAAINYEHDVDQLEDIDRTLNRIFNQNIAVRRTERKSVQSGISGYSLKIVNSGSLVHVSKAVNLIGNLSHNILQSFSSGTGTVIISPQASGTIEIENFQKYPVFIGGKPDPDEYTAIKSAFIIKKLDSEFNDSVLDGRDLIYISKSRMQARIRPHPEWRTIDYEIISQGEHHLECVRMEETLTKFFKRRKVALSTCTGYEYNFDSFESLRSVNDVIPFISSRLQVRGLFDINIQDEELLSSGIPLPGDYDYLGSGIKYEEVPLIDPSGISFIPHIIGDC